jgi:hypothetical protein
MSSAGRDGLGPALSGHGVPGSAPTGGSQEAACLVRDSKPLPLAFRRPSAGAMPGRASGSFWVGTASGIMRIVLAAGR